MDDVSARINQLLSDPESVEKIKSIAAALATKSSGEGEEKKREEPKETKETKEAPSSDMLYKLLPLIGEFGEGEKDPKVQLLRALKPYLTGEREKRMDDAVLILKLAKVVSKAMDMDIIKLDILKDLNIFRKNG